VYKSKARSYRDLPVRIAELGTMYRYEKSGVVGGLSRVRCMTLNDAHLFVRPDQVKDEIAGVLKLMKQAYADLGIAEYRFRLSKNDPADKVKYVDNPAMWESSTAMLREVLQQSELPFYEADGEAAFYGPKIDVQIADPAGREQTLSTVQLDYFQPERFGLSYVASLGDKSTVSVASLGDKSTVSVDSGQRERRPVMIHRSLLGSMERLIGHLLEIHNGWLPDWCAPVQAVVLPVHDSQFGAAREFVDAALARGLRAELWADGSLGARVRQAAERRVPHVAVIGAREAAAGAVALRGREPRPAALVEGAVALEILADSCEVPLRG
jgi:threonyl-tRNA synthetase